jgi:hypothetical protein
LSQLLTAGDPPQAFAKTTFINCHSLNRRKNQKRTARAWSSFRLQSLLGFQINAHGCSSPAEIVIRLHSSPRLSSFGYYALEYKDPAALSIVRVLYGLSYAANKAEQTWIG